MRAPPTSMRPRPHQCGRPPPRCDPARINAGAPHLDATPPASMRAPPTSMRPYTHQCERLPPQCGRRINASKARLNAGVASMRARPASMRASHQCEQGPPQCGRRMNASSPRINAGVASMRARPASMRPSHQCERGPHQCDRHIKVRLAHIKMAFSEQCEDIHINVGHALFLSFTLTLHMACERRSRFNRRFHFTWRASLDSALHATWRMHER